MLSHVIIFAQYEFWERFYTVHINTILYAKQVDALVHGWIIFARRCYTYNIMPVCVRNIFFSFWIKLFITFAFYYRRVMKTRETRWNTCTLGRSGSLLGWHGCCEVWTGEFWIVGFVTSAKKKIIFYMLVWRKMLLEYIRVFQTSEHENFVRFYKEQRPRMCWRRIICRVVNFCWILLKSVWIRTHLR